MFDATGACSRGQDRRCSHRRPARGGRPDRGVGRPGRCLRRFGGRERHHPARAHHDALRVPRRGRALRDVVRVQREGQVGRLDRAAARRADQGRARRRLDPAAPRARGRAPRSARPRPCAATQRPPSKVAGHPPDEDRRARHHDPARRRQPGREVGAGQRLPAHARRARGARLLRLAQPRLHGRQVRRHTAPPGSARQPARARRSCSRSRPRSRGSRCTSSASASSKTQVVQADVFLLTDEKPKLLAGGRGLSVGRSECGVDAAAQRPPLRQGHGLGASTHVVLVPEGRRCRRTTSTTTSRYPPTTTRAALDRARRHPGARGPADRTARARAARSGRSRWASVCGHGRARRWSCVVSRRRRDPSRPCDGRREGAAARRRSW